MSHYEGIKGLSRHILALRAAVFHGPLDPFSVQGFADYCRNCPERRSRASPEAAAPAGRPGEDWGEAEPLTALQGCTLKAGGGVGSFNPTP